MLKEIKVENKLIDHCFLICSMCVCVLQLIQSLLMPATSFRDSECGDFQVSVWEVWVLSVWEVLVLSVWEVWVLSICVYNTYCIRVPM